MTGTGGPRGVIGNHAEDVVVEYLLQSGYAIIDRNLRLGRLELDIVARQAALIVVVEVRTRADAAWTSGHGSLSHRKLTLIRRAGQRLWQRRYSKDPSVERLRFDAASVWLDRKPPQVDYVMAAF